MKTAIVLGSTGLVGSELVELLQASPHYSSVVLLNRRPSRHRRAKVSERIIDFDAPDLAGISGDDLYCSLGTTLRKAGSQAAQYKIDHDYPTAIASRLRQQAVRRIVLVSSVGADARASGFYLRTKGQLENDIIRLGFEHTVIGRPSVLIGHREEFRFGEEAGLLLMKLLTPFLFGRLRKYQGIQARVVARCLLQAAQSDTLGVRFIESDEMERMAQSNAAQ
jgi:uncharacterized protein YbjT (DUF2867 family)